MLDRIISFLPVRDVVALGETCRFLNNICNSQPTWKRICQRMNPRVKTANWRKAAILNYTKAIYSQPFRGQWHVLTCPVGLSVANGFQRILPTRDHMFVLDYDGTLFLLHIDMAFYNHGVVRWKAVSHYTVLAHKVKDFCGDPKSVSVSFKYLYVLMSQTEGAQEQLLEGQVAPSPAPCDCVELYRQSDGQRVFKLQFHPSMVFKQIALLGEETQRILLLLTEKGQVYSLMLNETQVGQSQSYNIQMVMRKVSQCLTNHVISYLCAGHNTVMYITDLGTLYYEIHSHGVYRNLFGTLQPFGSFDTEMPIAIPLSCKVVLCSISKNHLALADEHGRIFTQGNNRYGQLGTGDRTDRGQPSQVAQMKWPVQIWCGLNHTLILIQERDTRKEIFGCGCGAGGRLPGWARGSPVFVKLHVQVPLCTRYICSTRECLYMVCGYDTEEGTLYRHLPDGHEGPPGTHTGAEETGKTYQNYMSQLLKCSSPREHVAKAKEIVAQMPLQGQQKDFLWEALNVILRASDS
ncbi:F-box only protein 24 isoform X2 [Xenopus laevis]|nr:F-box only protein 24 isoform X2 [Xenopus laevis]